MSEHKQEKSNDVSMDVYVAARRARAHADELVKPAPDTDQDSSRRRYIMRLLYPDLAGASDSLVEVVGKDSLGSSDEAKTFLVSVRPVDGDIRGTMETHTIGNDGLISDTPDSVSENGYFLDATGIDEDEFRNVSRVELIPKEAVELKVIALPLPTEENWQ